MSLNFKFNPQGHQSQEAEATKIGYFNVDPLMCTEKCGARIATALAKIKVTVSHFDIPNKVITAVMPESMSNQQVIGQLQQHGFKAQQFFPVDQAPEKRVGFGFF